MYVFLFVIINIFSISMTKSIFFLLLGIASDHSELYIVHEIISKVISGNNKFILQKDKIYISSE